MTQQTSGNDRLDVLVGLDVVALLHRDDITEIYTNDDGYLWYQSFEEGKVKTTIRLEPERIRTMIELIAGQNQKIVNMYTPSISAEVKGYAARFQGELPPIVRNPQFNLRKRATKIFTLDEYVENGTLSPAHKAYIEDAIKQRLNILVLGGTGTGKTTFLNAILDAMARISPYHRIISLEDQPELQCPAPDYSPMFVMREIDPANGNEINYNMTRLLADCMRRSPDRIVVGEVRDGAAYTMLKAWNTGHEGGACTVHANSTEQGLGRIKSLSQEDEHAKGDIRELIGDTIDVIVSITHVELGEGKRSRRVNDIIRVEGYDEETHKYIFHHIPRE